MTISAFSLINARTVYQKYLFLLRDVKLVKDLSKIFRLTAPKYQANTPPLGIERTNRKYFLETLKLTRNIHKETQKSKDTINSYQ